MTSSLIDILRRIAVATAVVCGAFTAGAFSPTYYHAKSALSRGHWVKVKVPKSGIYQLTYDQLREMGFSDPSKVTVHGYGGASLAHQQFKSTDPDDVPQTPSYHTDDNRVLFYGEAGCHVAMAYNVYFLYDIRTNYSSSEGYYFLTDSQSPMTINRVKRNVDNEINVDTHTAVEFIDFNEENYGQGGARFFSKNLKTAGNKPIEFDLITPVAGSPDGYLAYSSAAKSSRVEPCFNVKLDNDITVGNAANYPGVTQTAALHLFTRVYGYQWFSLRGEGKSTHYTATIGPNASTAASSGYSYGANDWAFLAYPSHNTLNGLNQRLMFFPGLLSSHRIVIDQPNPTSRILVWDVTDVTNIRQFNTFMANQAQQIWFTPDRSYNTTEYPALRTLIFDTRMTFDTPEVVGVVPNQNIHAIKPPHMLIITNDQCAQAAERLAQAHRDLQGIDVVVLNQQQIFNEFSSGTPDVMAYRRVAKMFYDRDSSTFRSLLLFGYGVYDNRQIVFDSPDALLTFQTDDYALMGTNATNYCADDYFGYLDDYYNPAKVSSTKMNIAVGRIPARGRDIDNVVEKLIANINIEADRPYRNRVLVIADDNDANKHERQADLVVKSMSDIAPATTFTKVYNNIYPWRNSDAYEARQQIIQSLNQGTDYVMYVGHGNANALAFENDMWHKKYAKSQPYSHAPFWSLATCDTYAFDRLSDGIAETMLYNPDGGAVAVVASGRTVYADSNHYMNIAMGNAFASAKGTTTVGQMYLGARNSVMDIPDINVHINTMAYNLLGDPEVRYLAPEFEVEATQINGVDAQSGTPTLYPLSENHIEGVINDILGNTYANFNGMVTIAVYDAPVKLTTTPKDGQSDPREITLDETLLGEYTATVTNGKFAADIVLPTCQRPGHSNRIAFYAITDGNEHSATGVCSTSTISPEPSATTAVTDTAPPVISDLYIDTPEFVDGDEVRPNITIYADIEADPSGFNMATGTIGSSVTLVVDGNTSYPGVRSTLAVSHDGSATIQFPINGLQDGRHYLTLSVADNIGNRASRTVHFSVVNRDAKVSLTTDREYVRDQVTFDIVHSFTETPSGRLIIEDANGDQVVNIDNCTFPYTLDIVNSVQGKILKDGHYNCYTILTDNKYHGSSSKIPLVIIR